MAIATEMDGIPTTCDSCFTDTNGLTHRGRVHNYELQPNPQLTHRRHIMATITKRDLVISLSNETGLTQREVFSVIQGLIDSVTTSLAKNDEVVLRNFGTFLVKETKAKIGRNPNQPEKDVKIPPRTIVKFKPGKEMKDKVAKLYKKSK
jgi:nucleoid DNA-binding protein